jgi:hypothetical protein
VDGNTAHLMTFFHHQNGFADLGRLDGCTPARGTAADDNQIIVAQVKNPSSVEAKAGAG